MARGLRGLGIFCFAAVRKSSNPVHIRQAVIWTVYGVAAVQGMFLAALLVRVLVVDAQGVVVVLAREDAVAAIERAIVAIVNGGPVLGWACK